MVYYYVMGGRTKQRYDRNGRPCVSIGEDSRLPSVTLASCAAHIVSKAHNEPAEVWRVAPNVTKQVAVYFPDEIAGSEVGK